ncbi:hypothetical protein J1N10_18920 [Carboxylicivirga sp. A043]|uniref:DUF1574 domain-containing protein n=1 Tax=Carboxylicivirga litoralis TaxID=2816963 RepID=UPI0021CB9138|nr:DUF1574 domain-containing protein [Carboxylicivirga sp. A043]MCU4158055.1 hypothetical protein [Carboxylicivirga sp. A043]
MKRFLIKISLFLILFIALNQLLGNYIGSKRKLVGYYPSLRWDDFYNTKDNTVDIVFLGSSHCYRSLIPNIFDSILQVNSFNMGSSFQTPFISDYVLKEIINYQTPGMVILELHHSTLGGAKNFGNASHNFDFFSNSKNKYELIIESITLQELGSILFPTYRFNNLKSLIFESKPLGYGVDKNIHSYYSHKGYVETPTYKIDSLVLNMGSVINQDSFKDFQIEGVNSIIQLCQENDIRLLIVTQPYNPEYLKTIDNYKIFHNFADSIANSNHIDYIDFNLSPYKEKFTSDDFYDSGHLFKHGAEKLSNMVANEIKERQLLD